MSDEQDRQIELEHCKIKCIRCGAIWTTSLGVEWCNCLHCGQQLDPKKHIVADSENEVN